LWRYTLCLFECFQLQCQFSFVHLIVWMNAVFIWELSTAVSVSFVYLIHCTDERRVFLRFSTAMSVSLPRFSKRVMIFKWWIKDFWSSKNLDKYVKLVYTNDGEIRLWKGIQLWYLKVFLKIWGLENSFINYITVITWIWAPLWANTHPLLFCTVPFWVTFVVHCGSHLCI